MNHKILNTNTLRSFQCVRCAKQVNICTHCDRGNTYCNASCSSLSRKINQLAASIRYQSTFAGKLNHALCQRRYRARLRARRVWHDEKVIDQRSQPKTSELPSPPVTPTTCGVQKTIQICHFCGKKVSEFLRRGFLNTDCRPTEVKSRLSMALGP